MEKLESLFRGGISSSVVIYPIYVCFILQDLLHVVYC